MLSAQDAANGRRRARRVAAGYAKKTNGSMKENLKQMIFDVNDYSFPQIQIMIDFGSAGK